MSKNNSRCAMIIIRYDLDYPKPCYPDSRLSEHFIRQVSHLTSSLFHKNLCQRSTMLLTKEWYNFVSNSKDCCCMAACASWMDAKCVTLRRKLVNYIKDTIKAEVKHNVTTDMEETLFLCRIRWLWQRQRCGIDAYRMVSMWWIFFNWPWY